MATESTILRLGPADEGRRVSAEEFAEAEFDEPVALRTRGREARRAATGWIRTSIGVGAVARRAGRVYKVQNPDVVRHVCLRGLGPARRGPRPDRRSSASISRLRPRLGRSPSRVPDLIFEIVSPTKADRGRDYVRKAAGLRIARREGIRHRRSSPTGVVTVLTLGENGYVERILSGESDAYLSPLLPGFSIPIADVLTS